MNVLGLIAIFLISALLTFVVLCIYIKVLSIISIKLKQTLRAWIVNAIFAFGILKTGIAASGETLQFGDTRVDPGRIYTSLVDLDDFVIDPVCTEIEKATFLGDRIRTPRRLLLDTDGYDHDLVMQLPRSKYSDNKKVEVIKNPDRVSVLQVQ